MALKIERWAKQAFRKEQRGDFEPAAPVAILRDIEALKRMHRKTWGLRQVQLLESGAPLMMPEGTYGGLLNYPNAGTVTTTSINGTVNLWPQGVYSAFPTNMYLCPQAYRVIIAAKLTTGTSPGNFGLDPRIGQGTWTTGGTAITGTTLGATAPAATALTASITNAFYYVWGDITVRTAGAPGANWTAVGMFHSSSTQNTASGVAGPNLATAPYNMIFGGTSASFDGSLAQGFGLGAVHTVTTITHNVEQIHCMDWN